MPERIDIDPDPFSDDPDSKVIELPFWDEEMAGVFWPAVNDPTYSGTAEKMAALVNYVYYEGHRAGVRSILGRDS